jgi:hypothetical protein
MNVSRIKRLCCFGLIGTILSCTNDAQEKDTIQNNGIPKEPVGGVNNSVFNNEYSNANIDFETAIVQYSYASRGLYKRVKTTDIITDDGIIDILEQGGKGHIFELKLPNTVTKINVPYTINEASTLINLAHPQIRDLYVYHLVSGTVLFKEISKAKLVGEITGTFKILSGGEVSQGKITFEFIK